MRAIYHLTPKYWVQVAAFEDNFYTATNTPFVLGASQAQGTQIFGEVGSRTEFFNSRYPTNFELGVEHNTRHGYSRTKGSPLAENPNFTAADYPGGDFVFFQGLRTLWRGAPKVAAPPTNVGVYGSVDTTYDKPQPFDLDAILGVNFNGFVPGRPHDGVGMSAGAGSCTPIPGAWRAPATMTHANRRHYRRMFDRLALPKARLAAVRGIARSTAS